MDWVKKDYGKVVVWHTTIPGQTIAKSAVEQAFAEMWKLFVEKVIPLHSEVKWNVYRVEIWPDSGKLLLFPGCKGAAKYVHLAGCEVLVEALRQKMQEAIFSNREDEDVEKEMEEVENEFADIITESGKKQKINGVVEYWIAEDDKPFRADSLC
jgi:hypothetical protein